MTSSSKITVLDGGFFTTLQDRGRPGSRKYGVPPGGALDRFAWASANRLVDNPEDAAALEIILTGPSLLFETNSLIALTGADLGAEISDGRKVSNWMSYFIRAGQRLTFNNTGKKSSKWGRCTYLAVHGGIDAPLVMGSRATYTRAEIGGYKGTGRNLGAGDNLESGTPVLRHLPEGAAKFLPPAQRLPYADKITLRVIAGPYQDNFAPETLSTFLTNTYTLSTDADRMGFRLEGARLLHQRPELAEVASCATVFGAIQVPANGQPIVLMVDHQVTGGYPIIATIIYDDLPLLAQLLTGGQVNFILANT